MSVTDFGLLGTAVAVVLFAAIAVAGLWAGRADEAASS